MAVVDAMRVSTNRSYVAAKPQCAVRATWFDTLDWHDLGFE
jgi:hypothetical protein